MECDAISVPFSKLLIPIMTVVSTTADILLHLLKYKLLNFTSCGIQYTQCILWVIPKRRLKK